MNKRGLQTYVGRKQKEKTVSLKMATVIIAEAFDTDRLKSTALCGGL
jgi:hypothetical protein